MNRVWLEELAGHPPPKNKHWSDMIRYMVMRPRVDGTTPTNDEMAASLDIFRDTVARAKKRFETIGVIYRVNYNGIYAYNRKMLVIKDSAGKIIDLPPIAVRAASSLEAYQ